MFGSLFSKSAAKKRTKTPSSKASLQVEALEQRDVPTIMFMPHFGVETMAYGSANTGTLNATVNVVFSGPFWNTTIGQQDQATILNSTKAILGGTYLSGLTQYGSDGKATFGQSWNFWETLPNNASGIFVQSFLQDAITAQGYGAYPGLLNDYRHAPIYMVISDPHFSANSGGWNGPGKYTQPGASFSQNMNMIHIGTQTGSDGHIVKDWFTMTESHELAEVMSDPNYHGAHYNPPTGILNMGNQIADNEPELGNTHYGYRLNGDLVQPYWSARDRAFIVPDGNVQKFNLIPIWSGNTFTAQFNLNVIGDQLGVNYADNIHIDSTTQSNASVAMNGEAAMFEPGSINAINVNTAGGSNHVDVAALPSGVSLNLDSSGTNSHDAVLIGSNGSLTGILGTVNIANTSGQSSVTIDDVNDSPRTVVVTDHSVTYSGLTTINYKAGYLVNGVKHGVTSLLLEDSAGSSIDAESVGALCTTSTYWYPMERIYGPAASKIHVIYPKINAINPVASALSI